MKKARLTSLDETVLLATYNKYFCCNRIKGSSPSPFDRFLSNKFGSKVAEKMLQFIESSKTNPKIFDDISTSCMIASTCEGYKYFNYQEILDQTNIALRTPKNCWWSSLKNILNILSRSDFTYHSVTVPNAKFNRVGL
uniref:ATP-dependent 6-phosphofructokinase, muscle type (Trinotate prediction) n=1 Tax=Myxobolus squamalis TaxID=59785 RepID=A0A6B2FZI1_MYXSQ